MRAVQVALIVAALASPGLAAAQDVPRLAPVVVTPGRIQQQADDAPASVTVIGGEEVRKSPSQTVDDLLRQVPTFSLFRRSSSLVTHPTAQGVSLRGIGPSGASRAIVLVDGIPANDPFGGWVPWSRIPTLGIDQIEIVRGGGSSVWGSGALGGVIHVLTRRPRGNHVEFEASHGSFDTTSFDLWGSAVHGPFGIVMEGAWFETGGYPIVKRSRRGPIDRDADSRHGVLNGRIELKPSKDLTLYVAGSWFDEERQNGTRRLVNDTAAGTMATGVTLTTSDGSEWQAAVFWQKQMFHSTFTTQAVDRASETMALDQRSPSVSVGGSFSWARRFGRHGLLVGTDARWVEGETDEEVFVAPAGAFARIRVAGGEQFLAGAYLQDSIEIAKGWQLVAGIRGDWVNSYDGRRKDVPPAAGVPARQRFSDSEYVIVSPRLGTLVKVASATDVHASVYQGFRAPTLNELYRSFRVRADVTVANEHLEPERLIGGEAGVRQRVGPVDARGTVFWNEVQDQILNVTTATALPDCVAGTTCRQRRNVELTRIRGAEGEIEIRPTPEWRVLIGHAYTDAQVIESHGQPALEGKRLAQVPKHVTTGSVRWERPEWLAVQVSARFVGGQFEDDVNTLPLGRYTTLDVHLSRAVTKWGTVFLAVENLTNEEYTVARTSEGVSSIGSPRIVRGGLRLAF
jgi:outer membrane receptor protein involved in Fe transport